MHRKTNAMPFPVDLKWIIDAENRLGMSLPLDLRARLAKSNGGELTTSFDHWMLYPVWDKTNRKTLTRTCNDIVRETQQARKRADFPDNAIALGANGRGDHLVVLDDKEEVFAWDHETGELVKQADSFAELLA